MYLFEEFALLVSLICLIFPKCLTRVPHTDTQERWCMGSATIVCVLVYRCISIQGYLHLARNPGVTEDTVLNIQFGQCTAITETTITYLRLDQSTVSTNKYQPVSAPWPTISNFWDHLQLTYSHFRWRTHKSLLAEDQILRSSNGSGFVGTTAGEAIHTYSPVHDLTGA